MITFGIMELLALALILAPVALLVGALALIIRQRKKTTEVPRDQ